MANINFTKEEDELIALIEDAVIAGKNKMDIIDNLDDKFADVKATRFDYLYTIAKRKAACKEVDCKNDNAKEIKNNTNVSKKQQVLEMTLQGMSISEIAEKLGCEKTMVNTYMWQLRKEGKLPKAGTPIPVNELTKHATSDFKADEIKADKYIVKHAKCVQEVENSVKHPNYYNTEHYECWSVWKEIVDAYNIPPVQAALLFNVFKYVWRYAAKGTPLQDLNKAANYIEELIREVEE